MTGLGPLLSLIYLLTYSDTERALLGLVSMVWCKHGFSDEDQILIENLYFLKFIEQKKYF